MLNERLFLSNTKGCNTSDGNSHIVDYCCCCCCWFKNFPLQKLNAIRTNCTFFLWDTFLGRNKRLSIIPPKHILNILPKTVTVHLQYNGSCLGSNYFESTQTNSDEYIIWWQQQLHLNIIALKHSEWIIQWINSITCLLYYANNSTVLLRARKHWNKVCTFEVDALFIFASTFYLSPGGSLFLYMKRFVCATH